MPKSMQFWLPVVRWFRMDAAVLWPDDVMRRGSDILGAVAAQSDLSLAPVWVCGATSAVGSLALAVHQTIAHWPQHRQAQALMGATEVAARLALLEQALWGVPDVDLAAGTTAQVLVRACGAGLGETQTAEWMHAVWNATLAEQLHLTPGQVSTRLQAASGLLHSMPTFLDLAPAAAEGWEGLWFDLGSVWCSRAIRQLPTAHAWDEAPVRAMQNLLRSYQSRNHEQLPLEDIVSITVSETIAPAGLPWRGAVQASLEVARCMVHGGPTNPNQNVALGTERMVGHFAQRVRSGFEPRARMAGHHFISQLRWDSIAACVGLGPALAWLLFGRTPWTRGYGWRELMRAWRLERRMRLPLMAAVAWAIIGRLGPGGGARSWLVRQQCEQSGAWEPAARVELRSRSGVAWAAES